MDPEQLETFCKQMQGHLELVDRLYDKLQKHHEALQVAIGNAFPGIEELERIVTYGLGKSFESIKQGKTYDETILNVIKWAVSKGCLLEFISAAYGRNSTNPKLNVFIENTLKSLVDGIAAQIPRQSHVPLPLGQPLFQAVQPVSPAPIDHSTDEYPVSLVSVQEILGVQSDHGFTELSLSMLSPKKKALEIPEGIQSDENEPDEQASNTQDLDKIKYINRYKEQRKAQKKTPDAQFLKQARLHIERAQQYVKNAYDPLTGFKHPSPEQFRKSAKFLKAVQESIQSLRVLLVSRPEAFAPHGELIIHYIIAITPHIKNLLSNLYRNIADNSSEVQPVYDALEAIHIIIDN